MTSKKLKILFVDDRKEFRRLFELSMQDHPDLEIVKMSPRADDLVDEVEAFGPDVVVLDLSMPGQDPLEALAAAKKHRPEVRFLVFTLHDDGDTVKRAMAAGADAFMVKDGGFDDLAEAIRKVASDGRTHSRA